MVNIVKKLEQLKKKYRYSTILLRELVITDFKLRYQNSVLGYLWALLRPLFLFAIMYVFFVIVLNVGGEIRHWGPALLLGIVFWNFFSEVVKQGLKSITASSGIIRKINFPKYIIVLSTSLSAVINLTINLCVVVIFSAVNQVEPSWGILLLPIFIIELYVFALGLAFILSTINVKFKDIGYIWDIISQALFYGSAIMYPMNRVVKASATLTQLLIINPVSQTIQDARYFSVTKDVATAHTVTSSPLLIAAPFILTMVTFMVGIYIFRKHSPKFAENI